MADIVRIFDLVKTYYLESVTVQALRGVSLAEVEAVLGERTRQTGLDEKAARKGG